MTDVTTNRKLPVQLADRIIVEAVHYDSGTLCISSQAGCAVGCPFCASGQHGLRRNLTLAEFDLQVATAEASGLTLQRITISGIGEPLHNWANVVSFMERCRRRQLPVSITTAGAPLPRLAELLTADHNGVMLSLHAADAATHRQLVPGGPDFSALRTLLGTILPSLPRRRRRKVGINYLLLAGLNDQPADLARLIAWLRPWPELTLHLLAWNEVENRAFATDPARIDEWHAALTGAGINTRRPNRWRGQTVGGCGTLFIKDLNENGDCP